ncbi:hypothetical protein [Sphingobacterium sp. LRF_L2]|uniref:hypothetical protein n=1 Tax=Sphingobacterium sp. LRF_L2 TaxID=3369421 RepID=UPI003F645419
MNMFINKNRWIYVLLTGYLMLSLQACQSWNKWDDPSGNQVYPTLQKLVTYAFNNGIDSEFQLSAYEGGNLPKVATDNDLGSSVLQLDGGYAKINNPLNSVKVQNGVSFTFWMKQANPSGVEQDLSGALLSFQNETGSQKAFITANGWLSYQGDGTYEDNNPSAGATGIISTGEWHYIALKIRNNGYAIYVDGENKIDKTVTDFDFSKIVQFIATAPSLYIGYGSGTNTQEWMVDDLSIYRNQITDSQIAVPATNGSSGADYIVVGNEDFSSGWWTSFSDFIPMTGNQTTHYGFYNYSSGNANWNNWVLAVTNGKNRNETGYAEYFVLRADAFGWGDGNYNGANITSNYNWDTFSSDMNGAYVDLTIKRNGTRIDVTAVVTAKSGTVYNYSFFYEGVSTTDIGSFLTVEGAYLNIDPETVYVGQSYAANASRVGPADLSAGWWSYFSDFTKISGSSPSPFIYTFYNYTNGSNNWNNWLLALTNGKNRSETGYAEYFILRADAFGWGDSNYAGGNISASYDWDNFKSQMNGALVKIILTRSGTRVDVTAKVTTAAGEQLEDYTFYYDGISTTDIGTFLTVEGASLDLRTAAYYPFLNTTE